ncbi:hypothetical protein GVAV_002944 [Gurleya vavrai]
MFHLIFFKSTDINRLQNKFTDKLLQKNELASQVNKSFKTLENYRYIAQAAKSRYNELKGKLDNKMGKKENSDMRDQLYRLEDICKQHAKMIELLNDDYKKLLIKYKAC